MRKITFWLVTIALVATPLLASCTTPTMEYRIVHLADTATEFHFIDPREDTIQKKESELDNVDTFSIYLYEPTPDVPMNYTDFFTFAGEHVVYIDPDTDDLYTREKPEIADAITQYYIEKENFES